MVQNKLICKLIDFFMENDSPYSLVGKKRNQMGSNYALPRFDVLILTVSYIARHMRYIPIVTDENN